MYKIKYIYILKVPPFKKKQTTNTQNTHYTKATPELDDSPQYTEGRKRRYR